MSAIAQCSIAPILNQHKLFCTYKGKKYRVTGCSRMGDIWITLDFTRSCGYEDRVDVAQCSTWAKE